MVAKFTANSSLTTHVGDAQALWRIVMTRIACDSRSRAYMERRTKEGRSKREVVRMPVRPSEPLLRTRLRTT